MPASEATGAELGRLVAVEQAESRLPSVSAAVLRDGEVVWSGAVGLADAEGERKATPDTQYRIGSITKTFTAAAIMQLRDTGLLDLDDPIGRHLPEAPHGQPSLRRLLSHLSGLQREPPGEVWESLESPDREQLLAGLSEAEQVLAPGERWHYSNLAFALLGEVVERASEMPYRSYLEERLLAPVGLERTTFDPVGPVAQGYFVEPYSDTIVREQHVDLRAIASAGQLWSTTGDLLRWGRFLSHPDPDVLAPRAAEQMRELQAMHDAESWTLAWGLGLALYRRGGRVYAGHTGGMPGHLAALVFSAKERAGAAVLTNTSAGFHPEELALRLAERSLELEPPVPEAWRPGAPVPSELAPLLGRWWSEGAEFVFGVRDGKLEARLADAPKKLAPSIFEPEGPDRFRTVSGREQGELLRVVRAETGAVVRLYWATYPFAREPEVFGTGA